MRKPQASPLAASVAPAPPADAGAIALPPELAQSGRLLYARLEAHKRRLGELWYQRDQIEAEGRVVSTKLTQDAAEFEATVTQARSALGIDGDVTYDVHVGRFVRAAT
jgi:hypothetical protein